MSLRSIQEALAELAAELAPGFTLERVSAFGADEADGESQVTLKAAGYGLSLRVHLRGPDGERRDWVLHTATSNDFGHDRRADRAAAMILDYDTFNAIPRHARALDLGAIFDDGSLRSLREAGELYLLTEFVPGQPYAGDLRRLAGGEAIRERDRRRCQTLAEYLVELHADRGGRPAVYTRALRDLIGHGEGIYGMVDGYPEQVPAAPPERLAAIEAACATWRWRLRGQEHRLTRTHGDFHPFNLLFDEADELAVLDASRGTRGDPADDVTCLAINYVFMALEEPETWHTGLGELHRQFWRVYLEGTGDSALAQAAPPYLAWRALVLANPVWYPALPADARDALLSLAERALEAGRYDPDWAEALFS